MNPIDCDKRVDKQHEVFSSLALPDTFSYNNKYLDHTFWSNPGNVWFSDDSQTQSKVGDHNVFLASPSFTEVIADRNSESPSVANVNPLLTQTCGLSLGFDTGLQKQHSYISPSQATYHPTQERSSNASLKALEPTSPVESNAVYSSPVSDASFSRAHNNSSSPVQTTYGNQTTSPISDASISTVSAIGMKRAKNKAAAAKCRKKTKHEVAQLQEWESCLHQRNKVLSEEVNGLREEVFQLKSDILRHGRCNDDLIDNYLQQAALHYGDQDSRRTDQAYQQPRMEGE
ncbi:hypothetical protein F5Y12DRAFT_781117 [Xylaria sp. FL1777]|nr:hypothetical protein F5Y12DRAFT_781117 [Xylaria sp. FL1777]